jgi:hypothetical protein
MQNEMHDPEMSYRRGYHQRAQQVLDAIKHHLPMRQSSIVHAWIADDVLKWRVAGLKRESKRDHDGSTVMCQPPIERLSKIGG